MYWGSVMKVQQQVIKSFSKSVVIKVLGALK